MDLREAVLDNQFTGKLTQSLIQQGPQEWVRSLVTLLTLVVYYCLYELRETLIELNGFNLNVDRVHKV